MSGLAINLFRFTLNGTIPGLFKIRFQYILALENDQKNPIVANLTDLGATAGTPDVGLQRSLNKYGARSMCQTTINTLLLDVIHSFMKQCLNKAQFLNSFK